MARPSFQTPKYAFLPNLLGGNAGAWMKRHRRALTGWTTAAGVGVLAWQVRSHGGWEALPAVAVTRPSAAWLAVALWPLNLGLEALKWRLLKARHLDGDTGWRTAVREVLVGQTWALLGPFRLADGAGRWAAMAPETRPKAVALAFGWGAAAQGWATWTFACVALMVWGWPGAAALGLAVCGAAGVWMARRGASGAVLAASGLRYAVFALQYIACLVAVNVVPWEQAWAEAFPRVAAVWCALHSIPWPVELGMREAAATLVFDQNLPAVVVATFGVWLLNRAGSAAVGAAVGARMHFAAPPSPPTPESPDR